MVFESEFKIRMKDIGKGRELSNIGIMSIMEETAILHSCFVGFGVNEYKKEIMPHANALCTYCRYNNKNIVIIRSDNLINCIVELS